MIQGGIAIPELVLLDIVKGVLASIKDGPELVEWVMQSRPEAERRSILTLLKDQPGRAVLGWAHEGTENWQVLVFSPSSEPTHRTVGLDYLPSEEDLLAESDLTADIGDAPETPLPLVAVPAGIPPQGRVRIHEELATYRVDAGTVILEARGVQQTLPSDHAVGSTVEFHALVQSEGWGETCHLRVDVVSNNSMLNLVVATILKAALVAGRATFEEAGLTLEKVSETDMAPRPQTWPAMLQSRTLQVQVQRGFSVPVTLPFVTRATVDLTTEGTDVQHASG